MKLECLLSMAQAVVIWVRLQNAAEMVLDSWQRYGLKQFVDVSTSLWGLSAEEPAEFDRPDWVGLS